MHCSVFCMLSEAEPFKQLTCIIHLSTHSESSKAKKSFSEDLLDALMGAGHLTGQLKTKV